MGATKELLLGQEEQQGNNPIDCTVVETPKATSLTEAIRQACFALNIDHDVAEAIALAAEARYAAPVSFASIEAVALSVDPNARPTRDLYIHEAWNCGQFVSRSLAQAQEIAAAIVAEFGGSVEVRRFEKHPGEGDVKVITHGIETSIFYDGEEVQPHA